MTTSLKTASKRRLTVRSRGAKRALAAVRRRSPPSGQLSDYGVKPLNIPADECGLVSRSVAQLTRPPTMVRDDAVMSRATVQQQSAAASD